MKIRGYRIELSEIESLLLQQPGVAQAVVNTFEPEPGMVELVAYYTTTEAVTPEALATACREDCRLPRLAGRRGNRRRETS